MECSSCLQHTDEIKRLQTIIAFLKDELRDAQRALEKATTAAVVVSAPAPKPVLSTAQIPLHEVVPAARAALLDEDKPHAEPKAAAAAVMEPVAKEEEEDGIAFCPSSPEREEGPPRAFSGANVQLAQPVLSARHQRLLLPKTPHGAAHFFQTNNKDEQHQQQPDDEVSSFVSSSSSSGGTLSLQGEILRGSAIEEAKTPRAVRYGIRKQEQQQAAEGGGGGGAPVPAPVAAVPEAHFPRPRRSPPPLTLVAKPSAEWIPDSAAPCCQNRKCGAEFGLFLWRHHCRLCGGAFCASCSSKTLPLVTAGSGGGSAVAAAGTTPPRSGGGDGGRKPLYERQQQQQHAPAGAAAAGSGRAAQAAKRGYAAASSSAASGGGADPSSASSSNDVSSSSAASEQRVCDHCFALVKAKKEKESRRALQHNQQQQPQQQHIAAAPSLAPAPPIFPLVAALDPSGKENVGHSGLAIDHHGRKVDKEPLDATQGTAASSTRAAAGGPRKLATAALPVVATAAAAAAASNGHRHHEAKEKDDEDEEAARRRRRRERAVLMPVEKKTLQAAGYGRRY